MKKISGNLLFISLFFLCAASAIGWAIVSGVSGRQAGQEFLFLSCSLGGSIFFTQVLLFFFCRNRLFLKILFIAAFGVSLIWFMLSLALPILWVEEVAPTSKIYILSLMFVLFAIKSYDGISCFGAGWRERKPFVADYYDSKGQILDWEKFVGTFRISFSLLPSGAPMWMERIFTVLLVISMIAGLNLRKIYPVFSIFAWGIPCVIASGTLIQITALNLAQAFKVIQLEKAMRVKINTQLS